jgi:AraC-like DNA-binding protein
MGDFIFIGSLFCCFISAYFLLIKRKEYNSFSDKLLAFLFICYAYCTISYLLITSGWLIYAPFLYKTAQPVNFLIPPLAYLYVRSILKNEKTFLKYDFFHFLPFFIIIINYIPFYFVNIEDKMKLVNLIINKVELNLIQQDGIFNEKIQFLRPIQCLIYILLQWKLILKFETDNKELIKESHTKLILTWLKKFTFTISITILAFIAFIIIFLYGLHNGLKLDTLLFYSIIPVGLSLFYLSSYLVINQNILEGLPYINYLKKPEINNNRLINYEEEANQILEYFENNKPFLKQNITINEISIDINIPLKLLSFIINQYFKLNFNDFVNKYRVHWIVKRMQNGDLDRYTLISISQEAGFSNKTTFLSAFKKVYNCTPTQFFQNQY